MNKPLHIALLVTLAAATCFARAEIYMGLLPGTSLAAIKLRFPNATIDDVKVAWTGPQESFKKLSGPGLIGIVYMDFSHTDGFVESMRAKSLQKIEQSLNDNHTYDQKMVDDYTAMLQRPLDVRLTLDWVRWIPPAPIPYVRLVSKFGKAEQCDYDPETFAPFCKWTSRGVQANLNDAKLEVISIEYSFTKSDWDTAYGIKPRPAQPATKPQKAPPQAGTANSAM